MNAHLWDIRFAATYCYIYGCLPLVPRPPHFKDKRAKHSAFSYARTSRSFPRAYVSCANSLVAVKPKQPPLATRFSLIRVSFLQVIGKKRAALNQLEKECHLSITEEVVRQASPPPAPYHPPRPSHDDVDIADTDTAKRSGAIHLL